MNQAIGTPVEPLHQTLQAYAELADTSTDWPSASWSSLQQHEVLRRSIPRLYGGLELSAVEQLIHNEELAAQCLTTAFILSQHEAAIRQLLKGPAHLQKKYLPSCASGNVLLTVGLSQLTTSRQHGRPALLATPLAGGEYQLDGAIPWVTAADHATAMIGGATLNDHRQLLFVISPQRPGMVIDLPMALSALAGSRTTAIHFQQVRLQADEVLVPPIEQVLGKTGGGGLETSCLAIGLARSALDLLRPESLLRVEVAKTLQTFDPELQQLRTRLHQAASTTAERDEVLNLRADCTLFVLRTTQLALLLIKGTGFLKPHPIQRLCRQALFFLVWSCPRPAKEKVWQTLLA